MYNRPLCIKHDSELALVDMKVIIAPQGFKGGILGLDAAKAIARGVVSAAPDAETVLLPVADGGDGTLHALVDATGGEIFTSTVTGPINQKVEAQWGVMGDGRTAVIEMARASGLAMVPPRRRNPRTATTLGTTQTSRISHLALSTTASTTSSPRILLPGSALIGADTLGGRSRAPGPHPAGRPPTTSRAPRSKATAKRTFSKA